jgi:hypothetical protein
LGLGSRLRSRRRRDILGKLSSWKHVLARVAE